MRLLVFSDTHRHLQACFREIEKLLPYTDAILHAGDVQADIESIQKRYKSVPVYGVRGNNDFASTLPNTRIVELEGKMKLLLTHGHLYGVKYGYDKLIFAAKEAGAQMAVFGHTHQSCDRIESGVRLLNPGSAGYFPASYAVIEMENGHVHTDILWLEA